MGRSIHAIVVACGRFCLDFFEKMWQAEMEAYAAFGSRRSMVTHRKLATATLMRSPGR